MSEQIDDDQELLGQNAHAQLWATLGALPRAEPGRALRYRVLQAIDEQTNAPRWWQRFLPVWPQQMATFALVAVVGVIAGLMAGGGSDLDTRVARLEGELTAMNQQLLLSQLNAASAPQRLAAAFEVSAAPTRNAELAGALVQRAIDDPVVSVRAAAISALGQDINQKEVATTLFDLLVDTDSPIVQMAIVDVVLRHGDERAIRTLRGLIENEKLHPSLRGYAADALEELRT